MKRNMYIIILVAIVAVVGVFTLISNNAKDMDNMSMSDSTQSSIQADTSSDEYKQFAVLKGEEYDRMFLANMIAHHEGAVEMANMALTSANHEELKALAQDIVSAQTNEITQMTEWQKAWGFPASNGEMMEDHSAMGMMDDNATMMEALANKTGDDFDKAFLEQMIMHHQSAINMAAPGKDNALHQEVKDLTAAIVTAQTNEIVQMKQWQMDWGYDQ